MSREEKEFYEFGEFRLEVAERRLMRLTGERVQLSEKAFQTLCVLVRNGGHLLTKDELLKEVWADSFVEENNLDKCIYAIRQALGEKPGEQKFIETVRKHGYRFVAELRLVEIEKDKGEEKDKKKKILSSPDYPSQNSQILSTTVTFHNRQNEKAETGLAIAPAESIEQSNQTSNLEKSPENASRFNRKKVFIVGAIGMSLALLALGYFALNKLNSETTSKGVPIDSIAVMPFANFSQDPNAQYLSDGITETLINSLSQIPGLRVMSRDAVFDYKNRQADAQKIGGELNVRSVLKGNVKQIGDQLIINIELIDAADNHQIWGERYIRKFSDILLLQGEIARDVITKLRFRLTNADEQHLAKRYATNSEAYRLYLLGRFYWNKRTVNDFQKSIEHYEQAIAVDPNYALAFAGLAESFALLPSHGGISPREAMPKARSAALKALSLDDRLAEAHTSLGLILNIYDYDFVGAEARFKRAIELNPNYATAHQFYAELLGQLDRREESFAEFQRALELDPLSLNVNRSIGLLFVYSRKYDEAIAQFKRTLELDANFAVVYNGLALAYQLKGSYAESVTAFARYQELIGKTENTVLLRKGFSEGGWQKYLRTIMEDRRQFNVSSYSVATFHAQLGEKDKAFAELNKVYESHESQLLLLKVDPRLDPLRDDPRFQDLMRRVGFSQ